MFTVFGIIGLLLVLICLPLTIVNLSQDASLSILNGILGGAGLLGVILIAVINIHGSHKETNPQNADETPRQKN